MVGTAETYGIHYAKTHLSELIARVERTGEPILIRRGGSDKDPVVRIVKEELHGRSRRIGGLTGALVPEDFDTMLSGEIAELFEAPR